MCAELKETLCIKNKTKVITLFRPFLSTRQLKRLCSFACVCDVSECFSPADSKLFKTIQSPSHCLSHILPPEKNLSGLRSRGHGYVRPICQYSFCRNSYSQTIISFFCNCQLLCMICVFGVFISFFRCFQHFRLSFVVFLLIKRYHHQDAASHR